MRRLAACALLVVAATAPAVPAEGDLTLEIAAESRSVKLGEDAVLTVTLTNHAASAAKVPSLRLSRDSVSIRVASAAGATALVTRLVGSFLENEKGGLEFRPSPAAQRRLDTGESEQVRIALPALLTGELTLTAVLGDGTAQRMESKPVSVDVQSKSGQPQHVAAQVETSRGGFRIDLDPASAYGSVASFWTLARENYFDGLTFHRVLPGALAQTGDPRGNGSGGPGWYLPAEPGVAAANRGDVGLARGAHSDSAGSQWFVVTDAKGTLAGGYVRLGTVTEGLDVLDQLTASEIDAKSGRPKSPDRVITVKTVVR